MEIPDQKLYHLGKEIEDEKLQQPIGEFPALFALVPWGHHVEIISKCKSVDEAILYINKTIEQEMSRAALVKHNWTKSSNFVHSNNKTEQKG